MNWEQFTEFYQQNFYYIIAAQVGIGLIFGAIPLVVGIRKGKTKLGLIGFILSGIAGGGVSILVAAIFLALVLRKDKTKPENSDPKPTE